MSACYELSKRMLYRGRAGQAAIEVNMKNIYIMLVRKRKRFTGSPSCAAFKLTTNTLQQSETPCMCVTNILAALFGFQPNHQANNTV
jgi:hypothetical protein